jgi:hypothetical protein
MVPVELVFEAGEQPSNRGLPMLASIFVTLLIILALAATFISETGRGLITRRPYNNRYNDASAAREEQSMLSE